MLKYDEKGEIKMRILVFSDSHKNVSDCTEVIENIIGVDMILHAGDHAQDAAWIQKCFPDIPVKYVVGNCDANIAPAEMIIEAEGITVGAVDIIKDNPYMLCGAVPGIGFEKADIIAKDLGMRENCAERIAAGIAFVLSYNLNQNGHVYLPQEKLIPAAGKLLGCTEDEAEDELARQIMLRKLRSVKVGSRNCIYLREAYEAER
jgi:ATP-dependent exoDNAse (exonuclease V) alpha subunit